MMTIHLTLIKKNPLTLQVLLAQKLGKAFKKLDMSAFEKC